MVTAYWPVHESMNIIKLKGNPDDPTKYITSGKYMYIIMIHSSAYLSFYV